MCSCASGAVVWVLVTAQHMANTVANSSAACKWLQEKAKKDLVASGQVMPSATSRSLT